MSIRPIDFQVMFPKTSEVAKNQNDEMNKNQIVHQQQAAVNQERTEHNLKQVVQRENVHEARVREKQEKDNGDKQNQKKKKQQNKRRIPNIDIKI